MASHVETIVRSVDLLNVQFEFVNLRLDASVAASPRLVRDGGGSCYLLVRFPPQHVAEYVHDKNEQRSLPYKSLVSGSSRLAFEIPASAIPLDYKLDAILDLLTRLAPIEPGSTAPSSAIEVPFRVLLVPRNDTHLSHSLRPKTLTSPSTGIKWSELWHTKLLPQKSPNGSIRFRAIENTADGNDQVIPSAKMTLDRPKRKELVTLSQRPEKYVIESPSFMLTALGATARLRGAWPDSASNILSSWDHHIESGRDSFVRVVEQGYLYPYRHRASRVVITRRDFTALNATTPVAELQRQVFVRIRDAEVDYGAFEAKYTNRGREMPLKTIRITSQPSDSADLQAPVRISAVASDCANQIVQLSLTAFFVSQADLNNPQAFDQIKNRFAENNRVPMSAQRMAIADDQDATGATSVTVNEIEIGVQSFSAGGAFQPPFLPLMASAQVGIPAVEQLFGSVTDTRLARASSSRTLVLHPRYLRDGLPPTDRNQVFAKLVDAFPSLTVPTERCGGIAAPTFQPMDGLSRVRGLVPQVDQMVNNTPINPDQLISDAKLLGVIELKKLISELQDNLPVDRPEQMFDLVDRPDVFVTRPVMTTIKTPAGDTEARFLWKPRIKTADLPKPIKPLDGRTINLVVRGRIRKNTDNKPTFEVDGRLSDFGLKFGGFITVDFRQVRFQTGASQKVSVDTEIEKIEFGPELAFIEKLNKVLPTGGLGGLPLIQPGPEGIVVRYGIGLPSFAIGVLSLQNIAIGASLSLPFIAGRPAAVRVSLSERAKPFLVSVSIFGGTGFFALEVRTDGSVLVEAAIEFGGVVSINLLGIVSGGVYVFVGIYVAVRSIDDFSVTGHLRLGGFVDVMGLITVSIEVYIGLTYQHADKALIGEGRLTVSVKLIFFTLSKSFVITRRLKGFGEEPTEAIDNQIREGAIAVLPNFPSTMSRFQWDRYCKAFG